MQPLPPPAGTDLNGRWGTPITGPHDAPVSYFKVVTLRHSGKDLRGEGEYCSDVVVSQTPNPMAFSVVGEVMRDATSDTERVTLTYSGCAWRPGSSTNTYAVSGQPIVSLRGINGTEDLLINLDMLENLLGSPGPRPGAAAAR